MNCGSTPFAEDDELPEDELEADVAGIVDEAVSFDAFVLAVDDVLLDTLVLAVEEDVVPFDVLVLAAEEAVPEFFAVCVVEDVLLADCSFAFPPPKL